MKFVIVGGNLLTILLPVIFCIGFLMDVVGILYEKDPY